MSFENTKERSGVILQEIQAAMVYSFFMIASAYSWVLDLPPRSPVRV